MKSNRFFIFGCFLASFAGVSSAFAWETFHGDRGLSGVAEGDFPAEPGILWRVAVEDGGISLPCLVAPQAVYGFTDRGRVVSLGLDGAKIWSLAVGSLADSASGRERLAGTGVLAGRGLGLATDQGLVALVDRETGDLIWRREMGAAIRSHLGLAGDGKRELILAMAQGDGSVHAFQASNGEKIWQSPQVERSDCPPASTVDRVVFGSCAAALHSVATADGRLLGALQLDANSQIAAGAAVVGKTAYAGHRNGGFIKADLAENRIIWNVEAVDGGIFSTPAVANDSVVFGADDGTLTCLARSTGERIWQRRFNSEPSSPVIVDGKVLTTDDGVVYVLALTTGEILWQRRLSDAISPVSVGHGMAFIGTDEGEIVALGAALAE